MRPALTRVAFPMIAAVATAACGASSAVSPVRFHNRAPVWQVDDRRPVPEAPETRRDLLVLDSFDSAFYRRVTRILAVPDPVRARDVNSLGEVPDSTWFTNRIGRRALTPDQVRRGPGGAGPDLTRPLAVLESKTGGSTPGFLVEDHQGRRFLLKLDDPLSPPETASGANVISNRLLWACGYHVPNDIIGEVRREDLRLGDEATFTDEFGRERPMTPRDIDDTLAFGRPSPDGAYRVLYSQFLPGRPIGGFPPEGVRPDDPNDTIAHQHRRSLRGLSLLAGWLQHTDIRERNTLDMYREEPVGHVVHYLVDFDKTLGVWAKKGPREEDGHTEQLDEKFFVSLVTLGLWRRPWEGTRDPDIRGVAMFDAEHYEPGDWSPSLPYAPFLAADEHDMLWAVRIALRFTRDHIRAATQAAKFTDPRAEDYLTEVLVARRDKAARYWLRRVNPLVGFDLEETGGRIAVCFEDLELDPRVAPGARPRTRYRGVAHDHAGRQLALPVAAGAARGGRSCLPSLPLGGGEERYTIVRLDTFRSEKARAPIEVHVAREPGTGAARVIGINR